MNKKVFKDILINLFASSLCTAALNLIVYPLYGRHFNADDYGNILTFIGVINLLIAVLGNCLNNTRLVLNRRKEINNEDGNYNPTIMISSLVGCLSGVVIISCIQKVMITSCILLVFTLILGIARAYYIVAFRLILDYTTQLKVNVVVSIGYIAGSILVKSLEWWPLPFCLGEGIAFFYTIKKSTLIKEPFCFSDNKKTVLLTYTDLILTGLIGNVITYFDRFLINPLLGAASVATFSVASFWGKAVTPFISPTANVMLSYLCQKDSKMTTKKYVMLFLASIIPLIAFGLIGVWLAPIITSFLYPTLIDYALPYIFIASFGSLIQSSTTLLMPVLLSVCTSRMVLILQGIYFGIYLVIAYLGAITGGLMGFCYATCIIGIIKTLLYFLVGLFHIKRIQI